MKMEDLFNFQEIVRDDKIIKIPTTIKRQFRYRDARACLDLKKVKEPLDLERYENNPDEINFIESHHLVTNVEIKIFNKLMYIKIFNAQTHPEFIYLKLKCLIKKYNYLKDLIQLYEDMPESYKLLEEINE